MGIKVLIVAQWFVSEDNGRIVVPGGTERYVYTLAKQLQSDGYEVMVLSATTNKEETGVSILDGLMVYKFKISEKIYGYYADFLSFINTFKFIIRFDPDIVHVIGSSYRFAMGAVAAAKIMKARTVYTRTTLPHKENRRWLPVLFDDLIATKIIKQADVIIALSREMKDVLEREIRPKLIEVIPNPLTKNYYKKIAKEPNSILFVGRLETIKGIDLLIKALSYVQMEIPDIKLDVCGRADSSSLEYLMKLISIYKLGNSIQFHGHLTDDELIEKYSSSEVIVVPSLAEGSAPYVLMEAMSAGLPIIAFDIGPIAEFLEGGKYGILVKKGDVYRLAQKIIELLKDKEKKIYYSKISTERIKEYSKEIVVRRIEEVYSSLIRCV